MELPITKQKAIDLFVNTCNDNKGLLWALHPKVAFGGVCDVDISIELCTRNDTGDYTRIIVRSTLPYIIKVYENNSKLCEFELMGEEFEKLKSEYKSNQ